MKRECVTCGKTSDEKKNYFELSAKIGPRFICRDSASELGINNFMSAGFHSNTGILKKYVKIHPEAQFRLDVQLERLDIQRAEIKSELNQIMNHSKKHLKSKLNQMMDHKKKHLGCQKQSQTKCICNSCGTIYYYGFYDAVRNLANVCHGSLYSINQAKDLNKCPNCGSRAVTRKETFYWVDKKGNCVDVDE